MRQHVVESTAESGLLQSRLFYESLAGQITLTSARDDLAMSEATGSSGYR